MFRSYHVHPTNLYSICPATNNLPLWLRRHANLLVGQYNRFTSTRSFLAALGTSQSNLICDLNSLCLCHLSVFVFFKKKKQEGSRPSVRIRSILFATRSSAFSHTKSTQATSQPAVLFSHNKSATATASRTDISSLNPDISSMEFLFQNTWSFFYGKTHDFSCCVRV